MSEVEKLHKSSGGENRKGIMQQHITYLQITNGIQ